MWVLRILMAGLFKSTAFLGVVAIILALLVYDSPLLVASLDLNLKAVKWAASQLPQGFGNRSETLLRLWNIDRVMIGLELTALVEGVLFALGRMFRISPRKSRRKEPENG